MRPISRNASYRMKAPECPRTPWRPIILRLRPGISRPSAQTPMPVPLRTDLNAPADPVSPPQSRTPPSCRYHRPSPWPVCPALDTILRRLYYFVGNLGIMPMMETNAHALYMPRQAGGCLEKLAVSEIFLPLMRLIYAMRPKMDLVITRCSARIKRPGRCPWKQI